jgi:hypothetical protein
VGAARRDFLEGNMNSPSIRHLVFWTATAAMLATTPRPTWSATFSAFTRTDYAIGEQLSVAVADFNHDGRSDFAGVLFSSSVNVFLGTANGTFAPVTTFSIGQSGAQTVVSADVNGDGNADLLVTSQNSSNLSVLPGNGDGTFAAPLVSAGSGKYVKTADFNNDGRLDVVVNGPGLFIRLGHGDGTFGPGISVPASGCTVTELMVGDFNEDGMQDIAALNPCPFGAVSLFLGNGNGTFGTETRIPIPHTDFGDVGDLNGDGHADIVSSGGGGFSILLGNGDGTFSITNLSVGWELRNMKIADLNQDGFPDLAAAEHTLDLLFLVAGHGDGTFEAAHALSSGHRPLTVGVGDFNDDGLPDVLTPVIDVSGVTGGVSVFLGSNAPAGNAPVLTAPSVVTVTEGSTVSFGVSASDPDGDPIGQILDAVTLAGRTFMTSADNTSGTYSWTPGIGLASTQPYPVVFTARNALASYAITQIQVDTLLSANVPVLAQPSDMTVTEGFTQDQTLTATDADGTPLAFSKVSGPTFMTVQTTNQGTGSATGNIHLAPGPSGSGAYPATVRASDGALYDDKALAITVIDSPGTPVLAPIANMSLSLGQTADQAISASDPDADAITFSFAGPAFMTVTSNPQVGTTRTGNIHLAPLSTFGSFIASVTATANGQSDSHTFTITVSQFGPNNPPTLNQPANMTVQEGSTADQTLTATDPDGNALTFYNVAGPIFMTVTTTNATSGNVHLAPDLSSGGNYTGIVRVSDGSLYSDDKFFSITVLEAGNRCPVANPGGPYSGLAGVQLEFDGSASSDADGDPLTYAWDFGDGSTGVGAMVKHTYAATGNFTVTLTVMDPTPCSASATTTAAIEPFCPATVLNGYDVVRLNSGRVWFAFVQPVNGCYANTDVVLSSFVLKYNANQIPADMTKTTLDSDRNKDGIPDLRISFSKDHLRTLFSGLPSGHTTVDVVMEASLTTGGILRCSTQLVVVSNGSFAALTIAPNPFNPEATLTFTTKRAGSATVALFDVSGRLVRRVLDEPMLEAGTHDVRLLGRGGNGEPLASGIYFVRVSSADGDVEKRVAILK